MKTAIIGGGASGLACAISINKASEVYIFDKNSECGKKILVTGAGKCNYLNSAFSTKFYNTSNKEVLNNFINEKNFRMINDFFDKLGIIPQIKNGYYYPYSMQAVSVQNSLLMEAKQNGVIFCNNETVLSVKKEKSFIVETTKGKYFFDNVVVACGGSSMPKFGSTGDAIYLLKDFNIESKKYLPALVQLKGYDSFYKKWAGIRTDVILKWFENNQYKASIDGELQLTDYGISGICTLNLSGRIISGIEENKKESIFINFLPFVNDGEFINRYKERISNMQNRTIVESLEGILNYKLLFALLGTIGIDGNKLVRDLKISDYSLLESILTNFEFRVSDYNGFDASQVSQGGILLSEIDLNFEVNKVKGLYVIGEALDVDGICGGYNLAFAWLSGIIAGRHIGESND